MIGWYAVRSGATDTVTGDCKPSIPEAMADADAKDTDHCTPRGYNLHYCQLPKSTGDATSNSGGLWIAYAVVERGSKLSVFDAVRSSAPAAAVAVEEEVASRNEEIAEGAEQWAILFMRIQLACG